MTPEQKEEFLAEVRGIRSKARNAALEEAAQIASVRYKEWGKPTVLVSCDVSACEDIASAIRALKEPEQ